MGTQLPARDMEHWKNVRYATQGCLLKLAEQAANDELLHLNLADKKDPSAWFMVGSWHGPDGVEDNLKMLTP